ncbi:flavodoxin [Acidovorax sp. SUPP1855]|uniref:flavodoxin n=1 Tax=Acidovorax sp. SUPP1855 TaxID=431774 RepID=UPI0023DE5B97|nr:flavodoxin [Acidovorax sp. SUPP1855]GKS86361.1 flavodoxin [Acidovorax sp. SUPP1855]
MAFPPAPDRRALMASLAGLSLGGPAGASTRSEGPRPGPSPTTLVACFSRTGNTRVVAGLIQRAHGADFFEIQTAVPYPAEYLAVVEQARKERDSGLEPALHAQVPGIGRYDTIFLGFPIWGETAPPAIRSFLSSHDLAGKTLIPFVTHGGYGLGNSPSVLAAHAPKARLHRGFAMEADQERRTMTQVTQWLQAHLPSTTRQGGTP